MRCGERGGIYVLRDATYRSTAQTLPPTPLRRTAFNAAHTEDVVIAIQSSRSYCVITVLLQLLHCKERG